MGLLSSLSFLGSIWSWSTVQFRINAYFVPLLYHINDVVFFPQMAGKVQCHRYSRRRPNDGWKFTVEKLGPRGKRGKGGGWKFVSMPDGSSRQLDEMEKMYVKRETPRHRRKIFPWCIWRKNQNFVVALHAVIFQKQHCSSFPFSARVNARPQAHWISLNLGEMSLFAYRACSVLISLLDWICNFVSCLVFTYSGRIILFIRDFNDPVREQI